MKRIKKDDLVKVIAGGNKGKIAKVTKVEGEKVYLEGVNTRTRHVAANRLSAQGTKRDIQLPVDASNIVLVVEKTAGAEKVSKVSYQVKNGAKTRIAKVNSKEVK